MSAVRRLPKTMIEEGIALAETCTFRGIPLCSMTREEAIAVAAIAASGQQKLIKNMADRTQFALELAGWRRRFE